MIEMEPRSGEGTRTYLVIGEDRVMEPVWIKKDGAGNLASAENGADYLLITHRFLGWDEGGVPYPWLNDLAALRRLQGLRVKAVDVEDIYDEFSYGMAAPHGVRDFLAHAYRTWAEPAPRYVLLVGDSTYDPKDNWSWFRSDTTATYVPAYLTYTEHMGETVSDEWFVRVCGDDPVGDLYIGRLPAATVEQATTMVSKIVGYETAPNGQTWERNVLLVADNVTEKYEKVFELMNEDVLALLPPGMNSAMREYLGDYARAADLTRAIRNRINIDGALLVNYSGHGSVQIWAEENFFNATSVTSLTNGTKLPFVAAMTCLTGQFTYPEIWAFPSMAEALLREPNKGAVAALMSTGMTVPEGQHLLDKALFEAIFAKDQRTIGRAVNTAKQELMTNGSGYDDVAGTFTLFGDPAMTLRVPLPTMPAGVSVSVRDGVVRVSWSQAQDCDGAAAAGYNLYRGTTPGGPYEKVNSELITATGYSDPEATSGTWYYVVSAVDTGGVESVKSGELSVTVGARSVESSGGGESGRFISTVWN
jgi:hypothetical protein